MKRIFAGRVAATLGALLMFASASANAQSPIGKEFSLHAESVAPDEPTVLFDPDGGFLATFMDYAVDGDSAWVRRFSSQGRPLGPDILVSEALNDRDEGIYGINPVLNGDGSFFTIWSEIRPGRSGIFVRHYSAGGDPLGDPTRFGELPPWFIEFALVAGQDRLLTLSSRFEEDFSLPDFLVVEEFSATSGASLHGFRPRKSPTETSNRSGSSRWALKSYWSPGPPVLPLPANAIFFNSVSRARGFPSGCGCASIGAR